MDFKPGEIPAQLKEGQEWLTLHQLFKEVFSMKAEDIHADYWIWDGDQPQEACIRKFRPYNYICHWTSSCTSVNQ